MDCKKIEEKIIDYIEEQLSSKDEKKIKLHLEKCNKCKVVFTQEKEIAEKLNILPKMKCPDKIINNVYNYVDAREPSLFTKLIDRISIEFSWKIRIVSVIAVIILLIVIYSPKQDNNNYNQIEFTTEEIENAKKETELALAYFQYYAKKTERIIEEHVITQPIIKPIKITIQKAFKPVLNGGNS